MTMTEARAHSGKTAEMQAARVVRRERRQRPRCLSPALLHPPHVDPLGLQQRRHAVLTHQMPGPDRDQQRPRPRHPLADPRRPRAVASGDDRGARRRDRVDILVDLAFRSEEQPSEIQSLMRISYAVFCLKKIIMTTN